jgi:predicted enzyme related to lactoylglutathione lyase
MPLAQIVIPAADLALSRAWYERNFGLEFTFAAPNVVALSLDGIRYLLTQGDPPDQAARGVLLYFSSTDIKADYARLAGPGSTPPHLIARMPAEEIHIAVVKDPAGVPIGLHQSIPILSGPASRAYPPMQR